MIEGIKIKKIIEHHDERGFFSELAKFGEETFHEIKQTSYAQTNPGVIKAFHLHDYWETWHAVKGEAKIVLHDLRKNSLTRGKTDVLYVGEKNKILIAIPPMVAHGYQVLGNSPFGIFYHAEKEYNPDNPGLIQKIPHDSPLINFDWQAK